MCRIGCTSGLICVISKTYGADGAEQRDTTSHLEKWKSGKHIPVFDEPIAGFELYAAIAADHGLIKQPSSLPTQAWVTSSSQKTEFRFSHIHSSVPGPQRDYRLHGTFFQRTTSECRLLPCLFPNKLEGDRRQISYCTLNQVLPTICRSTELSGCLAAARRPSVQQHVPSPLATGNPPRPASVRLYSPSYGPHRKVAWDSGRRKLLWHSHLGWRSACRSFQNAERIHLRRRKRMDGRHC